MKKINVVLGLFLVFCLFLVGCSFYPDYDQDSEMETEVIVKDASVGESIVENEEVVDENVLQKPANNKEAEIISPKEDFDECVEDADCGGHEVISASCFQGNVNSQYKDYYCDDGKCKAKGGSTIESCDRELELCREGECIEIATLPCNDTDGGKNYLEAGKVVDAKGKEFVDECLTAFKLQEAFCTAGEFNKGVGDYEDVRCEDDQICSVNHCKAVPDDE
jgi:hypothetical protein